MAGHVEVSSIKDVLNVSSFKVKNSAGLPDRSVYQLYLDNEDSLQGLWSMMSMLREAASIVVVRFFGQSISRAISNVVSKEFISQYMMLTIPSMLLVMTARMLSSRAF